MRRDDGHDAQQPNSDAGNDRGAGHVNRVQLVRAEKRNRRQKKAEEASVSFCTWNKKDRCCARNCAELYTANHVHLCRLALLHAADSHQFMSHRIKVISLQVVEAERDKYGSETEEEPPEDPDPAERLAPHLRREFFIDSTDHLKQYVLSSFTCNIITPILVGIRVQEYSKKMR